MSNKDYYQVMGLSQSATDKEIKMAYRRLARKYHPDISKESNAEDRFKELGEAYEVLKDPEKRKLYDKYGSDWEVSQQAGGGQHHHHQEAGWQGGQQGFAFDDDFFESIFGGRGASKGQNASLKGQDYHSTIEISLEDAFKGVVRELQFPAIEPKKGPQKVRVKIPKGVQSGQKIRLLGQGGLGIGCGSRGDLYLKVLVNKHPFFDVKNSDIFLTLPITPWEAALGSVVNVPTLGGAVDLKIPAGSEAGQKLRLKGKGLPAKLNGDQYIILKIVTPKPKTDEDKALYQKMAETMSFNPRDKMRI